MISILMERENSPLTNYLYNYLDIFKFYEHCNVTLNNLNNMPGFS